MELKKFSMSEESKCVDWKIVGIRDANYLLDWAPLDNASPIIHRRDICCPSIIIRWLNFLVDTKKSTRLFSDLNSLPLWSLNEHLITWGMSGVFIASGYSALLGSVIEGWASIFVCSSQQPLMVVLGWCGMRWYVCAWVAAATHKPDCRSP